MSCSRQALGQVVRELREARTPRLTQQALGTLAGYKTGAGVTVSRIESGLSSPAHDRLAALADALGLSLDQLAMLAARRTEELRVAGGRPADSTSLATLREQSQRLEQIIKERASRLAPKVDAFNAAHDKARDDFLLPFVATADGISGAPQPLSRGLDDAVPGEDAGAEAEAEFRLQFTSFGVAQALSGAAGAAALGGAAGAAVGGAAGAAAAYGSFKMAVTFGTASTGARIAGLYGAAARNAVLALLGGGTLAAGGRGVAGGTMFLKGIVAGPTVLLALGGGWMAVRRSSRQQQQQWQAKLDELERQLTVRGPSVDAFDELVGRAASTLHYIAVHGAHAHERWSSRVKTSTDWNSLSEAEQGQYDAFVQVCAALLAVATLDYSRLLELAGEELDQEVSLLDQVLDKSEDRVRAGV